MVRKKVSSKKTVEAEPAREALAWSPPGLHLAPADASTVTYRARPRVAASSAKPFDLEACLTRMQKKAGEHWIWHRCKLDADLTREEAHFWFEAISTCEGGRDLKQDVHAAALRRVSFTGDVSRKEVEKRLVAKPWYLDALVRPVLALLGARETLDLYASAAIEKGSRSHSDSRWLAALELHEFVVPRLDDADRKTLLGLVEPRLDPSLWEQGLAGADGPLAYVVAAACGAHGPIRELVASWRPRSQRPDELQISDTPAQLMIFGLPSQAEVQAEMRRLEQWLYRPLLLRAWLAHTGFDALDHVQESILRADKKSVADELTTALGEVTTAREVVPVMEALAADPRTKKAATSWLESRGG